MFCIVEEADTSMKFHAKLPWATWGQQEGLALKTEANTARNKHGLDPSAGLCIWQGPQTNPQATSN